MNAKQIIKAEWNVIKVDAVEACGPINTKAMLKEEHLIKIIQMLSEKYNISAAELAEARISLWTKQEESFLPDYFYNCMKRIIALNKD